MEVQKDNNFEDNETDKKAFKEKFQEIEANIKTRIADKFVAKGKTYRELVSAYKLLEIGAHIGLTARRWNPKMKNFVHAKKGNNYVIDLYHTLVSLNIAYHYLVNLTQSFEDHEQFPILVVGTKGNVIKNHVREQAKRTNCFYVNERWLGGTLTNFSTIMKSINVFNNLILLHKSGEIEKYTKKEKLLLKKKTEKYAKYFSGIRTIKALPKVLVLANLQNDLIALEEARKLNIPTIALCNTNSNPYLVDFPIPVNNNSIKTVYLLLGILFDAIAEAKHLPMQFVGKKDEEIILPEIVSKRKINFKRIPVGLRY